MPRALVFVVLASCVGGLCLADDPGGTIGLYFHPSAYYCEQAFVDVAAGDTLTAYLVVTSVSAVSSIGGYEAGLSGFPEITEILWPGGGNFGTMTNHLCGYDSPLSVIDSEAVLAVMRLYCSGDITVYYPEIAASEPSSIGGDYAAIFGGSEPDEIYEVWPSECVGASEVARIRVYPVAVEPQSLSMVKQLFK